MPDDVSQPGLGLDDSADSSERIGVAENIQTVGLSEEIPEEPPSSRGERLELYKFGVEMADRISARRGTANSFFLTVNTVLAALVGVMSSANIITSVTDRNHFASLVISIVGALISATWWFLLRSYGNLSKAKWDVINRLEDRMDIRLYQDEWKILKADQPRQSWRRQYRELGFVEKVVPLLFLAVYVAFIVWIGVS